MDGFLARTVRRILVCAGLLALVVAAAGANSEANALSISPSGSVPAQSTLTVSWTPGTAGNLAALIVEQVAPNGPVWFNNTVVSASATAGQAQITLPSALTCGPNYSYRVFEQEIVPSAQALLTWGNAQGSYSPSFTIKCPRPHPLPHAMPVRAPPDFAGKTACPAGEQEENGTCVAVRNSKGLSQPRSR